MHSPTSLMQKIVALCVLAILVVFALGFVVGFLERNWPWLLGIGLIVLATLIAVQLLRRGRGW